MNNLSETLGLYYQKGWAIPAFNVDTFEIFQAVELAVRQTGSPCLVQLSPGEDSFIEAEKLLLLVKKARVDNLPIFMNMDHGSDSKRLEKMVRLGIDMVHFDGSKLDYDTNLNVSQALVHTLKAINPNCLIEVEFNHINLVGSQIDPRSFTVPDQAFEFMMTTKADLLAVSIGNLHGVKIDAAETLDLSLLSEIHQSLAGTFLTLHGGSGIDPIDINQSLKHGIVKININTDLRLKFKQVLADQLSRVSSEKIYDYFSPIVSGLKEVMVQKILQFTDSQNA